MGSNSTYMPPSPANGYPPLLTWIPVIAGLAAILLPTFYGLARGLWTTEEQGHGPLVLAVVLYYFWQRRDVFIQPAESTSPVLGGLMLAVGLLFYALGKSQTIYIFEIGSLLPILAGTLLVMRGSAGLRSLWFPILFLVFMIPLPGPLIDTLTGPLKQYVSIVVENILYHLGFPIARNGVVLSIGYYQLLVADACSGLNSMFSLSALGVLYAYLMQYRSWLRNGLIFAAILPIAFAANVVRVIIITLVTYFWGDEAGQGFIHGFAGIVLFIVALLSLMLWDWVLGLLFKQDEHTA